MNLDDIKCISIREYLRRAGIVPKTETSAYGMYLSPLREECTASFKVDYSANLWYDHGAGEGGSIIDLVMRLEACSFAEAAQRLQVGEPLSVHTAQPIAPQPPAIEITDVRLLENPALRQYLQSRGIDKAIAEIYCSEAHFRINRKPYFAIGFQNDAGGWELRNEWFKGSSTPKNITTFPKSSDTVMLFEGFMDFLSYLTLKNNPHPRIDTAVLNSVANLQKAIPFLESHRTIHAFLDNDDAGRRATAEIMRLFPAAEVVDQSHFYSNHKDLNDYLKERQKPATKPAQPIRRKGRSL